MTVSEKIQTVDNKIEKNKAQCNLDEQTAKILALSSCNVDKNEFLRDEDVLPEKAATIIDNLFIAAITDNNKEDGDNREENKSDEYNISEGFETILKNKE